MQSRRRYMRLMILALALSIAALSMDFRYICVVFMELCPSASLITLTGMSMSLAMLAHEWRELYKAGISEKIDAKIIIDNNEYQ